jgi:phosphonate transport system permease protein
MAAANNREEPRESKTLAAVAGILSLIIPGLGQIVARQVQRGLLLLGSTATIVFILSWRVRLLAHREPTAMAMLAKALQRRPFFIGLIIVCAVILWLWIALDAYRGARTRQRGRAGIFILIIFTFFSLGWQISEINPVKMIAELPDAWPPLSRVLWPWPAAVTRETQEVSAGADILVPCDENPPPSPEEKPGKPYLVSTPTCGDLTLRDENNRDIPGTELALKGRGFAPNTQTEIWWADPIGNEFRVRQKGEYVSVQTDERGAFEIDVIMPYRLMPPSMKGRQIHRVVAKQISPIGGLKPSEPLLLCIGRMVETIFMGMMATIFGIILSIPVSFLAARNLMAGSPITMAIYYITRTILNIIRSIEPLIWALIAVVWVGLGPFAGIVALTVHSIAALGKLYSEAIENIDRGPIEAIQATGATRLQTIMFAVVPQMIVPFVSFSIYRWDINVRMSTVIGLVGGGGIGFLLVQYIRLLDYRAAGIAVWFIAVTVAVLDYVSAEIRQRFI